MGAIVAKRCSVIGCSKPVVSNGLCDTHRKRLERHDDVNKGRPEGWGRWNHPLNSTWKGVMRYHKHDYDPWLSFDEFVKDVKEKPDQPVRFTKKERDKPFGPGNWYWFAVDTSEIFDEFRKSRVESQNAYQRKLRASNPDYFRDKDLQKNYGVNIEWYNQELAKQNGVCAICFNPETAIIKGKLLPLSVDHCHDTGKVRGLLCRRCNNGIGHLNHDINLIQNAIKYLQLERKSIWH